MKVFNVLEEIKGYQKEIARLKEEYVMLQNSSDEVEEELQSRIDEAIEDLATLFGTDDEDINCIIKKLRGEENE